MAYQYSMKCLVIMKFFERKKMRKEIVKKKSDIDIY